MPDSNQMFIKLSGDTLDFLYFTDDVTLAFLTDDVMIWEVCTDSLHCVHYHMLSAAVWNSWGWFDFEN